jgi:hypothetical protein
MLLHSAACAASTRAWLVPKLELSLRSSRVGSGDRFAPAPNRRWDWLASGQLMWHGVPRAALIPSRVELLPDTWVAACLDADCVFPAPDLDAEEQVSW